MRSLVERRLPARGKAAFEGGTMADPALFKKLYRLLSWMSLAGLVLTLGLVLRKSPAPQIPYDPSAAARVEQKFNAADQARASGRPSQVQLDRTELNSYLTQNLVLPEQGQTGTSGAVQASGAPAGSAAQSSGGTDSASPASALGGNEQPTLEQVQSAVRDVKVDMDGDVVKAYVIFDFHGKDMSLELDGHLRSENGYLRFVPISGKLGSLPLPQSTLDSAVEKMMSSPENREKLRLPADVNGIEIVDGHAVISYK
jgi:hypothetical protein